MIRVGTSGWGYKDWDGIVYPGKSKPKGFDRLTFLSGYFDALEINTSFYGPPRATSTASWAESVAGNPRFRFTAKLTQTFTHQRNATEKDEAEFKDGMNKLMEAERLGAVLAQFPWSFRSTPENRAYVAALRRRFAEFPLVLEVRHSTWSEPEILDFLAEMEVGLCNIDQPLFRRSVQPGDEATSAVGYVRLHGRNYEKWFSSSALSHERYDYLYPPEELEPWVERIRSVERKTQDTYVMTNNHYLGKAAANGLEIAALLTGKPVAAPASLVERYPELAPFVNPVSG